MEQLLKELLITGGPLSAFVIVVYLMIKMFSFMVTAFLRHMAEQAELNRQMHKEMHNDNVEAKRETRSTMEILSNSVKDNTDATLRLCLLVNQKALSS